MIKSAFDYHESTNYDRKNMSGHYLDWKNQPMVFKDYPGVMPIVLPTEVNFPDIGVFDLIHKVRQEDHPVKPSQLMHSHESGVKETLHQPVNRISVRP